MYSVVLMMALTSGGDVPALGHGCCGGCWGGCGGCYGCCGGGHKHGCHGCRGCHGGHHKHGCCGGCYGCYGCYGGCYGGCMGGYGGCMGCYGGVGGFGGFGGGMGVPGTMVPQVAPTTTEPAPAPAQKKSTSIQGAPATLIVNVPAEARLTIDGEATASTATQRVFVSPALNFGREYSYTLQAEFKMNGKQVTRSKEVTIKAGEEIRVSFGDETSTEIVSR